MLTQPAQRMCIYISESDRWHGKALYMAILEALRAHGLAGATVLRGLSGFGAHSHLHTTALEALSMDLPIVIEVVDAPEKITTAVELVNPMVQQGLITLENIQVIKKTGLS
jgi:PII-like signaling protein